MFITVSELVSSDEYLQSKLLPILNVLILLLDRTVTKRKKYSSNSFRCTAPHKRVTDELAEDMSIIVVPNTTCKTNYTFCCEIYIRNQRMMHSLGLATIAQLY